MKWLISLIIGSALVIGIWGCGGDIDEPYRFTEFSGTADSESMDWVVEGMECNGQKVVRFVGVVAVVEDEEERTYVEYRRGDDCVDEGDLFWPTNPDEGGDEVSVLVDTDRDEYVAFRVEHYGDYKLRLIGVDGDEELTMRQAYPAVSPTSIPGLDNIELAGQWWMEGFPCINEDVPQLVQVVHPPNNSISINKVVGDLCVSDGEVFVNGELSQAHITGEPKLLDEAGFGEWRTDDDEEFEDFDLTVTGTVRTEHFVRLEVLNEPVTLRRVMAEPRQ